MRKSKKYQIGLLMIIVLAVVFISLLSFLHKNPFSEEIELKQEADSRIVQEFVQSFIEEKKDHAFISMFPINTYKEETFSTYLGADVDILRKHLDSGEQLVEVLEEILQKSSETKKVFLGIHFEDLKKIRGYELELPYKSSLLKQGYSWEEAILELGKQYPNVVFEILLYYPRIEDLISIKEKQMEENLLWYQQVADLYCQYETYSNIHLFMVNYEEWLICNGDNYQDIYEVNEGVAKELQLNLFCDYRYMVRAEEVGQKCDKIRNLVSRYREEPIYPIDEEAYTYVFFGDSVIGNYSGSMSIPGVVSYMTGATAINCGYGGLSATKPSKEGQGLKDVLDVLLAEEGKADVTVLGNENVQKGILEFWEADIPKDSDKLKFFIMFGINDYLCSHPVENEAMDAGSFRGALTYAVDVLQESYPNAEVILMTPNKVAFSEFGTLPYIEGGHVYREYVDTVYKVAEEKKVRLIDIFNELGITEENYEEYIPDMCHLGHYGRFKFGEVIQKHMLGLQSE